MTGATVLRVLYLDDDEDYAHLFKSVVTRLGCQTITYCVPAAALESLVTTDAPFDLFVTDFHMPGVNGLEVVRRARARVPGLRCAILSSDLAAIHEGHAVLAGACWVERKPEKPEQFEEFLARAMASMNPP